MPGKRRQHSAAPAMKAGSTITSRESHEVRHSEAARQARSRAAEVEEGRDQAGGERAARDSANAALRNAQVSADWRTRR